MSTPVLPDVLAPDLNIVFCGTAASAISAREGAYYANPTNYFWRTLHHVGFTPHQLDPQHFRQVTQYGIGLTDIAKHAQGQDATLTDDDFDALHLRDKIGRYQPQVVAFTSKRAAAEFFGGTTGALSYGLQSERLHQTHLWVLTSPSGAARRYWDEKVWQALAQFSHSL